MTVLYDRYIMRRQLCMYDDTHGQQTGSSWLSQLSSHCSRHRQSELG